MTPAPARPRARRATAAILGIGTALPHGRVSQSEAAAIAESFSCETDGQRAWLRRVFLRSGVDGRHTVLMNGRGADDVRDFYPPSAENINGPGTAVRMQRYALEAPALAESAARAALQNAALEPAEITHLITVSCTGFFAPGLDVELISRLALPPNVRRIHIGFMGCHAAFNALAAARDAVTAAAASGREARVLVCAVELCTLHFAYGWQPEKLVANALFADASSACVVGPTAHPGAVDNPAPFQILHSASLLLPNSRDAMTWRVGNHGFEMTLSSELPTLIGTHIRPWCESWLADAGLTLADISLYALHPGGPKILNACRDALALSDPDIQTSRDILSHHGNLSSATLLFLLQNLAQQKAHGTCLALGFGPGLMAEGMLLQL
ncbi:MAG TPA: type III polyketide synthase [Phycisphaerae bacterium]|nr:type III polyketide synthase [Phycisphaerae bacterium]